MIFSARRGYLSPLVFLVPFGVYLATMCPVVYLGDSGELTAAAFSLGIPHASGYPLYTLIGKLFCLIPLGNIGFRMNVMSAFFAALTVWLVYSFVKKQWDSAWGGLVGGLVLAFLPVFWSQTVSAEVYSLHVFFTALLIRLLWWWDETREFFLLVLCVFVTGISFDNHMQTVMLAPAVLFLVFSGDRKSALNPGRFCVLTVFFLSALSLYLLLPVRTNAGAAIHWGDPNTLARFWAHVSASAHRHGHVLNKTPAEYLSRSVDTFRFVWSQFGVILFLSVWGWVKLSSGRWKTFFVLVVAFDVMYAVFLNIVSLEVTAFTLPSSVVLAMLAGGGAAEILRSARRHVGSRPWYRPVSGAACCLIPVLGLLLNFGLCDQGRNYTAYEHAVNIFRTLPEGSALFAEGDNFIFPIAYGRMVEGMRADVTVYDRFNLIFKMPGNSLPPHSPSPSWTRRRNALEKRLIVDRWPSPVHYAVFGAYAVSLPEGFEFVPHGILHRIVGKGDRMDPAQLAGIWRYYSRESFYDDFHRDFMNRQVAAFFYLSRGKAHVLRGHVARGLKDMALASKIGFDDGVLHSEMAVYLINRGFFPFAKKELQRALRYSDNPGMAYNNWGYYYHRIGDPRRAVGVLRKAVAVEPENFAFLNNLGFALYETGNKQEALHIFRRSLALNPEQPDIRGVIRKNSGRNCGKD